MDIAIIATKECNHRAGLERELTDLGVDYDVFYVEESPKLVEKYAIRHSPNLLVDGKIVCRHQPSEAELRTFLDL